VQARASACSEPQQLSIQEASLKQLAADEVLIRSAYSGVSIGAEFALIHNRISWGPHPLCRCGWIPGIVGAVGSGANTVKVEDRLNAAEVIVQSVPMARSARLWTIWRGSPPDHKSMSRSPVS
jgi:Zn-dependent alcohol dehydrogenase